MLFINIEICFVVIEMVFIVMFGEFLVDFVFIVVGFFFFDVLVFKKVFGGVFVNVVVGVCRLGGIVVFIGKVGKDEFG